MLLMENPVEPASSLDVPPAVSSELSTPSVPGKRLWKSHFYVGTIGHHRLRPKVHRFRYSLYMMLIDLGEVDRLFRFRPFCSQSNWSMVQFRRSDYLGDATKPLDQCVRDLVEATTGRKVSGPIRLLTHLRYFGFAFNPVSFYYCYKPDGHSLQAIVADVTNTPWQERHSYVIPWVEDEQASSRHECQKTFHVSPFMEMDQRYRWWMTAPNQDLNIEMESHDEEGRIFSASLKLSQRSFSYVRLSWYLMRFPWMTLQVVIGIYWQALRIWLKGIPYVPHPNRS